MSQGLRSRLYDCEVTHVRTQPVRNAFRYSYSTFCIDLDEVVRLQGALFGTRWWNPFRFVARDFIFGRTTAHANASDMKEAIHAYALSKGVEGIQRVELVAHMRTFGYAFNPAAFYFCYGTDDQFLCAILEVTNTYLEKKAYLVRANGAHRASGRQTKEFYVSPFVDLDAEFDLKLDSPGERLRLEIDSLKAGQCIVKSLVIGAKRDWSSAAMVAAMVRFPLITLQVIAKIHYRALLLFLKKVPHLRKNDRLELQKGGLS